MATEQYTIPDNMRAVQTVEYKQPYKINTVPVPKPGPHDILVKVAVASYCHTDAMVNSGAFGTKLPATASHEGAGTIFAVGSAVTNFKAGDRVMCGLPLHPCDSCLECTGPEETWRQYCVNIEGQIGVHLNGAMADYVIADARTANHLPDEISSLSAAPLACAGRTIWRGLVQAELKAGDWVVLVGSGGGLGHLGVQFAKAMGLRVVGVDARDEGLELSRQYGADLVLDSRKGKDEIVKAVQEVTRGLGSDGAIVITDAADATAIAAAAIKMHGTVIQIALSDPITIPFHDVIFRDVRVKGSLIASPGESKEMLDFIAKHGITVKACPFNGLDSIEELLHHVHSGKLQGKAMIVVDPDQIEQEKQRGAKY
ncbi:unnamed protein product [Clonostachys rosea]|uniref:Enoyl reductase (ER) domain-containing protein n=1 Tax=Bionectria ochroleuca TaxID=29856 RepID=A0ABY6U6E4_BIOOC|nr:unnamed protein product [Clonostachys rosea]